MSKCYYCGKAGGHAPGCNERPELVDRNPCKEIDLGTHIDIRSVRAKGTKQQAEDAIRKAVEATVPSGLMSPEQVKAVLEALKSWPDVVKASPEMKDAWLYGGWDVTPPETKLMGKPIQITRFKFKDP